MQRPDEDTLRAIVGLEGDMRWIRIHQWMKESHYQAVKELPTNTEFNAGRVAELFDLLNKVATAKKELESIKK